MSSFVSVFYETVATKDVLEKRENSGKITKLTNVGTLNVSKAPFFNETLQNVEQIFKR